MSLIIKIRVFYWSLLISPILKTLNLQKIAFNYVESMFCAIQLRDFIWLFACEFLCFSTNLLTNGGVYSYFL